MKIEIDLASLGLMTGPDGQPDTAAFQTLVVERAAALLVSQLHRDALEEMHTQTNRRVAELVDAEVGKHVAAAMAQPIQKTTRWGERQGEPVSLLELIRLELERYLTSLPGSHGSRGYDREPQNLAELIAKQAKDVLNTELVDVARQARKTVADKVTSEALAAAVAVLNGEKR